MKTCKCGAPATDIMIHDVRYIKNLGDWLEHGSKFEPLCKICLPKVWNECEIKFHLSDELFFWCSRALNNNDT